MDSEREAAGSTATASPRVDPLADLFDGSAALALEPARPRVVAPWPLFHIERFSLEFIRELFPLLFRDWVEVGSDPDIALKPNWDVYREADRASLLRIYTVRENDQLKGYSIFSVIRSPHSVDSIQANCDVIWVDPALRGRVAIRFIRWCNRQLRLVDQVQVVRHHVKRNRRDWGKVLERDGFVADEVVYKKRLDQDPELNPREVGDDATPGGDA